MAAYPGCIILDPLRAFKGEADNAALGDLISSGGVSIWKEGDPVHLTQTAYGDIAEQIVNTAAGRGSEDAGTREEEAGERRHPVCYSPAPAAGRRVATGRKPRRGKGVRLVGYMRGSANRGSRGARGGPAVTRGGGGGRWAPY